MIITNRLKPTIVMQGCYFVCHVLNVDVELTWKIYLVFGGNFQFVIIYGVITKWWFLLDKSKQLWQNSQLWATENTQSCLGQNITKLAVKLNGWQDVNQRQCWVNSVIIIWDTLSEGNSPLLRSWDGRIACKHCPGSPEPVRHIQDPASSPEYNS